MTARHPLQKNCDRYRRAEKMGAPTPKAGSSTPFRPAEHPFRPLPPTEVDPDKSVSMEPAGPPCYRRIKSEVGPTRQEHHCAIVERKYQTENGLVGNIAMASCQTPNTQNIPEQLADLITKMITGREGEELSCAFQFAADFPPITRQSLSELDIQNIITNIKLRHDINFDRDLSFRPNLDGAKGQEKLMATAKYWKALVAELELYVRIFQGTPSLLSSGHANWSEVVECAQRRIPKMFDTIREVLKSLVPDQDHSRVEEHLDTPMLMQEIERGVCDLVRLAEWLAHLLKEHCAPMRDELVDKMVEETRVGAANHSSEQIVNGLRELLGILEAMKLDVANHQIRYLKTQLIDDTVSFERRYHLDRLVNGRTRVNIGTAHQWYESALARFRVQCMPPQKDVLRFHLEVFVRAVVSSLFSNESHWSFPETFYLDQDRLRALKSEIDDLIYFDICFDMFGQLLRDFGFHRPIPQASRHVVRASLSAIIKEGSGNGLSQWTMNSEHIATELVRQALILSRCPPIYSFDIIQQSDQRLRALFHNRFSNHASILESYMIPQILSSVNRHLHSSPVELFNNLITVPTPPPPSRTSFQLSVTLSVDPNNTLSPPPEQFTDLANRITHIILLHWRTWGPIAYVLEDPNPPNIAEEIKHSASPQPPSPSHGLPSPSPTENTNNNVDAPIVPVMKTGEPPDPGQEALGYAGRSLP